MAGRKQKCPRCEESATKIAELERRLKELGDKLAKAEKNSSNSSKPPSSDIVKPNTSDKKNSKKSGKKRKKGRQPGHQRHERNPFPEDPVEQVMYVDKKVKDHNLLQTIIPFYGMDCRRSTVDELVATIPEFFRKFRHALLSSVEFDQVSFVGTSTYTTSLSSSL